MNDKQKLLFLERKVKLLEDLIIKSTYSIASQCDINIIDTESEIYNPDDPYDPITQVHEDKVYHSLAEDYRTKLDNLKKEYSE